MHGTGKRISSFLLACMLVFSLLPAAAFAEADEGTLLENAIGQALVPGDPEGQEEDPGNAPEHGANLGSGEEQQPPLGDTEEPPQPLGHAEEQPQPLGDTEGQSETLGLLRGEEENSGTPSVTGVSMQSHCPPARTYTVTFNSNGGSTVNSITGILGGSTIARPADPTKSGFTFAGWYKNSGLTNAWSFRWDIVTGDITLYAKWTPVPTYIVTFNSNGGSTVNGITGIPGGSTVARPADPTKPGFTFAGWYKNSGLTNAWNFASDTVNGNITLYAKWTPVPTYTVTFNSNGGSTVNSITGILGGSTIARPADPTKPGFTFAGWYENTELTDAWNFASDTVNGNITLYAKWTPVPTYTVTFNSNGGSAVNSITGILGGSTISRPVDPTRSGFTFVGWFVDQEFVNAWIFASDTVTGNITLYAKWTPVPTYTVTFNSNGGSAVNSITGILGGSTIARPATPVKYGFTFIGWYKESALTNPWNFTSDTVTGNIILYARWSYTYVGGGWYYPSYPTTPVVPITYTIPKTGDAVTLIPYVLLAASALCALFAIRRKYGVNQV